MDFEELEETEGGGTPLQDEREYDYELTEKVDQRLHEEGNSDDDFVDREEQEMEEGVTHSDNENEGPASPRDEPLSPGTPTQDPGSPMYSDDPQSPGPGSPLLGDGSKPASPMNYDSPPGSPTQPPDGIESMEQQMYDPNEGPVSPEESMPPKSPEYNEEISQSSTMEEQARDLGSPREDINTQSEEVERSRSVSPADSTRSRSRSLEPNTRSRSGSPAEVARSRSVSPEEPTRSRSGSPAGSARSRSGSPQEAAEGTVRSRSGSPAGSARSRSGSPAGSARSRSGSPAGSGRSRSGSPAGSARSRSGSPAGSGRSRSRSPAGSARSRSGSPVGSARSRSGSPAGSARSRSGSPAGSARSRSGSPAGSARSRSGSPAGSARSRSRSGSPAGSARSRSGSPARSVRSRSGSPAGSARSRSRSGSRESRSRSGSRASGRSRSGSPKQSRSRSRSRSSSPAATPPYSPLGSKASGSPPQSPAGSDVEKNKDESDKEDLVADIFGSSDEEEEFEGFEKADMEATARKKEKKEKKTAILSDDEEGGATGEVENTQILPDMSDDENDKAAWQDGQDKEFVSDFDLMMAKKKEEMSRQRRKRKEYDVINDSDDLIADMIGKMKVAAEEDRGLNMEKKPAIKKLQYLPIVVSQLKKADLQSAFLDCGILGAMTEWLAPLPDKSLPNLQIRQSFLKILTEFPSVNPGALKTSGIGKAIMYLYKHPKEVKENRERAGKLINEWSRPLFNLTSNYKTLSKEEREQRDYDQLPKRRRTSIEEGGMTPRKDLDKSLSGEQKALRPGDPGWIYRARVPMPSNKDYVIRPKWKTDEEGAEPKRGPSKKQPTRYEKQVRKFAEKKKNSKALRAVPISIEGRNMAL